MSFGLAVTSTPLFAVVPAPVQVGLSDIVVSGHGVELYNVGTEKQISYFLTYHEPGSSVTAQNIHGGTDSGKWKTFHLPRIENNGAVRESCAIEGMPIQHSDGTIYLACAGGVLNKLTPTSSSTYKHEYWFLDGSAEAGRTVLATEICLVNT